MTTVESLDKCVRLSDDAVSRLCDLRQEIARLEERVRCMALAQQVLRGRLRREREAARV